jgi:hypothetical protein
MGYTRRKYVFATSLMHIINILRSYLMAEGIIIGFSGMLSIAQTVGIVGTMIFTLFSQRSKYRVCQLIHKLEVSMTWVKSISR